MLRLIQPKAGTSQLWVHLQNAVNPFIEAENQFRLRFRLRFLGSSIFWQLRHRLFGFPSWSRGLQPHKFVCTCTQRFSGLILLLRSLSPA